MGISLREFTSGTGVNFLKPAELNYGGVQIPKKGKKTFGEDVLRATIDAKGGVMLQIVVKLYGFGKCDV